MFVDKINILIRCDTFILLCLLLEAKPITQVKKKVAKYCCPPICLKRGAVNHGVVIKVYKKIFFLKKCKQLIILYRLVL